MFLSNYPCYEQIIFKTIDKNLSIWFFIYIIKVFLILTHTNSGTSREHNIRSLQQDREKYHKLSKKHFKNEGHYFNNRSPKKIEKFLKDWFGNKKLKLVFIMEYCNVATGYPVWRFDIKK